MNINLLIQSVLILFFTLSAGADSLDVWQWRNPTPTGNPLANVVYANGRFFACGTQGVMMISTNGTAWTSEAKGEDQTDPDDSIHYHSPLFARHNKTAPTPWKIRFGSHNNKCGDHWGCLDSERPSRMKL